MRTFGYLVSWRTARDTLSCTTHGYRDPRVVHLSFPVRERRRQLSSMSSMSTCAHAHMRTCAHHVLPRRGPGRAPTRSPAIHAPPAASVAPAPRAPSATAPPVARQGAPAARLAPARRTVVMSMTPARPDPVSATAEREGLTSCRIVRVKLDLVCVQGRDHHAHTVPRPRHHLPRWRASGWLPRSAYHEHMCAHVCMHVRMLLFLP